MCFVNQILNYLYVTVKWRVKTIHLKCEDGIAWKKTYVYYLKHNIQSRLQRLYSVTTPILNLFDLSVPKTPDTPFTCLAWPFVLNPVGKSLYSYWYYHCILAMLCLHNGTHVEVKYTSNDIIEEFLSIFLELVLSLSFIWAQM